MTALSVAFNLAIFFALIRCKSLASWLKGLPRAHRTVLAAGVVLLFAGHALNKSHVLFPFVRWSMYAHTLPSETVHYVEYRGVHADGTRVLLNPAWLFPPLVNGRIHHKLLQILHPVLPTEIGDRIKRKLPMKSPDAETPKRRADETFRALGTVYNRRHAKPVVAVEAWVLSTGIHGTDAAGEAGGPAWRTEVPATP